MAARKPHPQSLCHIGTLDQSRRANREQREREALADTLTLSARAATVAARHLTQRELGRYLERLAEIRDSGTPHQVIAATRAAESWLRLALAIPEGADASLGVDPSTMTREQRAVERARLLAQMQARSAETSDEAEGPL